MFHYSVKDGLPSKEVHSIFQDSKGYIWFSTSEGIARYNANTFKTFTISDGLPDNTVFEVMEDKKGRLWFRTYSGSIGYILKETVHVVKANKKIIELSGGGLISSFSIDENENLWLGRTGDKGFFIKISPPYEVNDIETILSQCVGSGVELRVIGDRTVFAEGRVPLKSLLTPYSIILKGKDGNILKDSIESGKTGSFCRFYVDGDEVILFSEQHIWKYNINTKKREYLNIPYSTITLTKDKNGFLFGTRNSGVLEYSSSIFYNSINNYLVGKSVTAIVNDTYKGRWFSTLEDGVYYSPNKQYIQLNSSKDSDARNEITCSVQFNDTVLYFGTLSGKIIRMEFKDGKRFEEKCIYDLGNKLPISGIYKLNENELGINRVSEYYFHLLDLNKLTLKKVNHRFKKTCMYHSNYLGMSVNEVFLYDPATCKTLTSTRINDRLISMVHDRLTDKVYIGGLKGLYVVNKVGDELKSKCLLKTEIEDLLQNKKKLFIATKSDGLLIKTGLEIDTIKQNKGLSSNACKKLFTDGDNIWVITGSGLSKINHISKGNFKIRNYYFVDYLFPEGINSIHFLKGAMVFFTSKSVFMIPVFKETQQGPFRISKLFVNQKLVNGTRDLNLEHNQSDVSVYFEALFYMNNRAIDYRYQFKTDSAWTYTRANEVRFPSLSPGSYSLLLQVKNSVGEWVNCEDKLSFTIEKPYWQKWWFILVLIALGISALFGLIYTRYKRLLRKEREKNELIKEMHSLEIKVVKAQMNPHFISNCLSAIQELIYKDEIEKAGQYIAKFSFFMRRVLSYSDKNFVTLKEELDTIKLNIELEQLRFKDDFEFIVLVDEKLNPTEINIPALATQPFIENAIWHGLLPLKGVRKPLLKVNVVLTDFGVNVEIEDNGVGRNAGSGKVSDGSRGTKLVKDKLDGLNKLANNSNYTLEIIDIYNQKQEAAGTKVVISLIDENEK